MQRKCLYLLLALFALPFSSATWGQAKQEQESVRVPATEIVHNIAVSKVHGIKIVSSFYDPATHRGNVIFKNDSAYVINSYHGRIMATHADGRVNTERELSVLMFYPFYIAKEKKYGMAGTNIQTIKPGELHTENFSYGRYYQPEDQITDISALFDLVVYANNTAEVADDRALQEVIDGCQERAKVEAEIAQRAEDVLHAKVAHPIAALVLNLKGSSGYASVYDAELDLNALRPIGETDKLAEFIELHREAARMYEEASHLKVVSQ